MSFEPTKDELQVFTVLQTRYREQYAEAVKRETDSMMADAAARGLVRSGYAVSSKERIKAENLEKYADNLLAGLLDRFAAIYGTLSLEMLDWIDNRLEESTVLLQTDEATQRAYLRAKQKRMIELGTLRARLARAGQSIGERARSGSTAEYDCFICHAFEDKEAAAAPLAKELARSYRVWYDDFALTLGDSIREKIERGLRGSRYGVVILSPRFFSKGWANAELSALLAKQTASGEKVILSIWFDLTREDVLREAPLLVDRKAVVWSRGLDNVVAEIAHVLG